MRWFVLAALVATACAHSPRPKYEIAYRPSRPSDCPVDFYGPTHPAPGDLVQLGTFPLQMSLSGEPRAIEKAVAPVACKAGATAALIREVGSLRRLGGGIFIRDFEIVLLAPPEPDSGVADLR